MRKIVLALSVICFLISCSNPETEKENILNTEEASETKALATTNQFDSLKALKVGADPYGMRKYVMAFLRIGPNRVNIDSSKAMELQRAHMANIRKMAKEGKLALAGPFYGTGELRGIYIFAVDNIEEAKKLTESDPAIQAGSLEMELIPWYGSAALMEVNEIHKTISKVKI